MDQELREYLDGFAKSIDARFGTMEGRFQSIERQLQEFREETAQHFEQVATQIRHTNVVVEGLRGEVQLVAEGVATGNDRLDRLELKVDRLLEEEKAERELGDRALEGRIRGLEKAAG